MSESTAAATEAPTKNAKLIAWVDEVAELTQPDAIHWCDGSAEEYDRLCLELVENGTFEKLSDAKRPNSYLARSDPGDVARVEDRTFICSERSEDAGPDQQLARPGRDARGALKELFSGSMKGRTMYVVPFSMGPLGSHIAHIGVQLTDSAYVAVSMRIMTRMGQGALDVARRRRRVRPLPALGRRAARRGRGGRAVALRRQEQVHRPLPRVARDLVLRLGLRRQRPARARSASRCGSPRSMARDEGWLAEHMLILKLTSPEGEVKYVTGAFPSACGKTNLAMLIPTLPGWTVETVGDDIAWMKFGDDGRLYAVNPEAGFFGVAPNTSHKTNPNAMATIERNSIFTNCALTDDGDIWWEGMTGEEPDHAIDWKGNEWTPESDRAGRPPERPLHHPRGAVPVDRTRVGEPRRRADRRLPLRRPPRDGAAAGHRVVRLGARRLPAARPCRRRRRRPLPARSGSCASTRWRCCRSAATTWPTTSSTG